MTQILKPDGTPLETGWLVPYLLDGDRLFANGRWDWWTDVCMARKVPPGRIPPLNLRDRVLDSDPVPDDSPSPDTHGVGKTIKHITDLCERMAGMTGYYADECFLHLAEWCLYGFNAIREVSREMPKEANDLLYTDFQLGRLQQNPFDYPAHLYQQMIGNAARGNGFFATPPPLVRLMALMTLGVPTDDEGYEELKPKSVYDPCGGTGIMLLYASDYCLNLHYQDIDPKLVTFARFNAWLYAPWMAWRPAWEREIEGLFSSESEEIEQAKKAAESGDVVNRPGERNRPDQLMLF